MNGDLISRSALLKELCNSCDGWCDNTECDCLNCKSDHRCDMVVVIAESPAVDAVALPCKVGDDALRNDQQKKQSDSEQKVCVF